LVNAATLSILHILKHEIQLSANFETWTVKPCPDFFRSLKQKLGAKDVPVVFVDDSVNNVKAAADLGFVGIHFDPDLDPSSSAKSLKAALSSVL
jgi:FMN phosphatase YigB (HAD superfamily)